MALHPRTCEIVCDPEILGGAACFSGTRIPVSLVLHWMSAGWDQARILDEYPQLTQADLSAGLRYAAIRQSGP